MTSNGKETVKFLAPLTASGRLCRCRLSSVVRSLTSAGDTLSIRFPDLSIHRPSVRCLVIAEWSTRPALGSLPLNLPLSFSLYALNFETALRAFAVNPVQFFVQNFHASRCVSLPSPARVCAIPTSRSRLPAPCFQNLCYQWAMKMHCSVPPAAGLRRTTLDSLPLNLPLSFNLCTLASWWFKSLRQNLSSFLFGIFMHVVARRCRSLREFARSRPSAPGSLLLAPETCAISGP